MEQFGDYAYFIFLIIFFIVQAIRKNRKKREEGSPENRPQKKPQKSPTEILEEMLGGFGEKESYEPAHEEVEPETEEEKTSKYPTFDEDALTKPEVPNAYQAYLKSQENVKTTSNIRRDQKPLEIVDLDDMDEDSDFEFEGRDAIIYSEIMNKKKF